MGNGNHAPLYAGCSVLCRTPRDIMPATLRIVPAHSQMSRQGDRIPPQILNLLMMQNGNRYLDGRQQQESQGIRSWV